MKTLEQYLQEYHTLQEAQKSSKFIPPVNTEQDTFIGHIKNHIKQIDDMTRRHLSCMSFAGFTLKYGQPFYINEHTFRGKRGTQKLCFMNAFRLSTGNPDRYVYVEGQCHINVLPIDHAWCIDRQTGAVVDPTLRANASGSVKPVAYFGVPFKDEYVLRTAVKTKVYGIISHTNMDLLLGLDKPGDFLETNVG